MKHCNMCERTLALENFNRNSRAKDGLQTYCKPCSNEYARNNYAANKDRYFGHAKARDEKMRFELRAMKEVPCTDCGVMYPWYVMDFDHLRDKKFDISKMMRRRMAWEKILAETKKCEVVCSNCHRARSFRRWSGATSQ